MPTHSRNGPRSRGRTGARFEHAKRRVLTASQICHLCGEFVDLDLKWPDPMSATVDHLIPVSQLSWDDPLTYSVDNLRPAHLLCNQKRGADKAKRKEHPNSRNWFE